MITHLRLKCSVLALAAAAVVSGGVAAPAHATNSGLGIGTPTATSLTGTTYTVHNNNSGGIYSGFWAGTLTMGTGGATLNYSDGTTISFSATNTTSTSALKMYQVFSGEDPQWGGHGNYTNAYTDPAIATTTGSTNSGVNGVTGLWTDWATTQGTGDCGASLVPTTTGVVKTCAGISTITFTFSRPITDAILHIGNLGGTSNYIGGSNRTIAFGSWGTLHLTSGQTVTQLASAGNFQGSGSTITAATPVLDYNLGSAGVGSGSVQVNGTYSSITMVLDLNMTMVSPTWVTSTNQTVATSTALGDASSFEGIAFQWTGGTYAALNAVPDVPQFTNWFNANGGTCSDTATTVSTGTWIYTPGASSCSRPGYEFKGWNTKPSGDGLGFVPGGPTQVTGDNTLYAQWTELTPAAAPTPTSVPTANATDGDPSATPRKRVIPAGQVAPVPFSPNGSSTPAPGSSLMDGPERIALPGTDTWVSRIVIPGQGTWTVSGGRARFLPLKTFRGTTQVRYRVQDLNGKYADSTFTVITSDVPSSINGGR